MTSEGLSVPMCSEEKTQNKALLCSTEWQDREGGACESDTP